MSKNKAVNNGSIGQKSAFSFDDIIAVGIFTLYLLVDFVPTFGSYAFADTQWLYLTILNFFVGFYIYYNKIWIDNLVFKSFFLSKLTIFYFLFLIISGISISVGLNIDEGFITFLRYSISFASFVLLFVVFYNKQHLFLTLASIVAFLIFIECTSVLKVFFENYKTMTAEQMRFIVRHHHDNINIFSSNILIKLPFIFFCIIKTAGWRRILFVFILLSSIVSILLLSSRSIIAGLSLQLLIIFMGLVVIKFIRKVDVKLNSVFLIFTLVLSILTIYNLKILNNTRKFFEPAIETSNQKVTEITTEIPQTSNLMFGVRENYWLGALTEIKNKPIIGCGLGNWKIESMKYERKWKSANNNAVHVHNDFLQVAAETGILNGFIFCSIFVLLLFINIKIILMSKNQEQSYVALIMLASTIGIIVDSFFNFPLTRPTIQLLFVFLLLFTLLNYFQYKNEAVELDKKNLSKSMMFFVLLLSFASIYPNYLVFKFYQDLKIAKEDVETLNLTSNEINQMFGDFPSLDETGTPIVDKKITYLIKENKFKNALHFIEKSAKINPYSVYATSLRVDLHNKKSEFDSAALYAKKAYDFQPNYQVFYERYVQGLARIKDTTAIIKAFTNLDDAKLNANHFSVTFGCLLKAGYTKEKSFDLLKKGLNRFPNDTKLLEINAKLNEKTNNETSVLTEKELQIKASKTNDYREIEKFYLNKYESNKSDFSVIENLGICYFQQKKYNLAITYLTKVVDANAFQNGKAEYMIAVSHQNLNNKKMACEMANLALKKNFQAASIIIQNNCN